MSFKPSKYQEIVFESIKNTNDSFIIQAVAGGAKTTTLVHALELIPTDKDILFLAFNKNIADELKKRVPEHVEASTFHSVCYRALKKTFGSKLELNKDKTRHILKSLDLKDWEFFTYVGFVSKLVGLAKNSGFGFLVPESDIYLEDLADFYDITLQNENAIYSRGFELTREVLKKSNQIAHEVVDFDDMIYVALRPEIQFIKYDVVCLDEAQDTNAVQNALLERMIKNNGRLIAVGDEKQAIYQWRGSHVDAMNQIKDKFKCQPLPLSVSYRCAKKIVHAAKSIVPQIEHRENAPEGKIEYLSEFTPQTFLKTDAILCRVNAPLIELAYALIANNVGCRILGREIGDGLINLIKRLKAKTIPDLIQRILKFEKKEIEKYRLKENDAGIERTRDKVKCLMTVIDNLPEDKQDIQSVINSISRLFSDNDDQILTLSTVHKCVHPNTIVETEYGLQKIKDINENGLISTPLGIKSYKNKIQKLDQNVLEIETKGGYSVVCTLDHGLTAFKNKSWQREEAQNLKIGDWLKLKLGDDFHHKNIPILPLKPKRHCRAKEYNIPTKMTKELAEFLGLFVADGTVFRSGFRVVKRYNSVLERFEYLCKFLFNAEPHWMNTEGTDGVEVSSTYLADWLKSIGGLNPNDKYIPDCILKSPLDYQAVFLKGLFEDGYVNVRYERKNPNFVDHISFTNFSREVINQVQIILLKLEIISTSCTRKSQNDNSSLDIYSEDIQIFRDKIGFISKEKNEKLQNGVFATGKNRVIPVSEEERLQLKPYLTKSDIGNIRYRNVVSRSKLKLAISKMDENSECFKLFASKLHWHYEQIKTIKKSKSDVFCIEVSDGNQFIQNGFDGWNCKGLQYPRVFILDAQKYMPIPWAKKPWQREGEKNIIYVAITRAQNELYYIDSHGFKPLTDEIKTEIKPETTNQLQLL